MIEKFDKYCLYCFTDDAIAGKMYEEVVISELPFNMTSEFLANYNRDEVNKFFDDYVSKLTLQDLSSCNFTLLGGSAGEFIDAVIRVLVRNCLIMRFCINYQNYSLNLLKN